MNNKRNLYNKSDRIALWVLQYPYLFVLQLLHVHIC